MNKQRIISAGLFWLLLQSCNQQRFTSVPTDATSNSLSTYTTHTKSFSVNPPKSKVDLLVVIDNSGSMSFEQNNMAERFGTLIDKLSGLDWQIGIITTDVDGDAELQDGRLIKFSGLNKYLITSSDNLAAAKTAFSQTIQRPQWEGSGNEQGIFATHRALERSLQNIGENAGLVRPGSAFSVVLVSDSNETAYTEITGYTENYAPIYKQHPGDESTFSARNFPQNLKSYFATNFTTNSFKFNSIIVRPGDNACTQNTVDGNENEGPGDHYKQISDLTGGFVGDVCAADYGSQLQVIGQNVVDQVNEVLLDCAPVDADEDGALDVMIKNLTTGKVLSDYEVYSTILSFKKTLSVASYKVTYQCSNHN